MDHVLQVAGIHDLAEAHLVAEAGANWLGLPLRLPSGRDDISEPDAQSLVEHLPEGLTPVLISYMVDAEDLARFVRHMGFRAVQLHGDIPVEEVAKLKELMPNLYVLKSLVVRGDNTEELLATQHRMDDIVDMYLTDTYHPGTGAMGATGLRHDWSISEALVKNTEKPVVIAGGLTPDNVYAAVRTVRPFGVDAHTGLEEQDGRKSAELVRRFCEEAQRAFADNDTHSTFELGTD